MSIFPEALAALQAKLERVYLQEADPDSWPGAGKAPAERSKAERGDRVWCKTDAAKTLTLIAGGLNVQMRQLDLARRRLLMVDGADDPLPPETAGDATDVEAEAQAQIDAESERLAADMIARLKIGAGLNA